MAEKNMFPYIVLPNLSADDKPRQSVPKPSRTRNVSQKTASASNVPLGLPQIIAKPTDVETLSPQSVTSTGSKALTRHVALSKQYAAAAQANSVKEIQAAQRRILMAHYEMRKSPRSLYPSDSEGCQPMIQSSNLEKQSKKLSLEALAQLFPHRIQRTNSCPDHKNNVARVEILKCKNAVDVPPENSAAVKEVLYPLNDTQALEKIARAQKVTHEQLKTRIDGLSVHVITRDGETSQLKQDLIDLQLLVLKEKKESEKSKNSVERLNKEIDTLEKRLCVLEKTVEMQEKNILDKILLLDEMDDSDTESDFTKIDKKPSAWISSSSSQNQIQSNQPKKSNDSSNISALKECTNWVPVAPDFDKLLQIIAMLNFRMDRNQSMKISRTGNATSFKHADSINLTLFKNGLVLGKTGFRSYATLSVIKLINEMFSGFFPLELHSQFPDGVVFVVADKRSVVHELNPSFFGPGVKLSDSKSTPILIPGLEKLTNFIKTREKPTEPTLSCTSLNSSLSGVSSSTSFFSLPEIPSLNSTLIHSPDEEHKMIILKLKNTSTGKCYKIQVSTSTTVDEIISHVEKYAVDEIDASAGDSEVSKLSGKLDLVLPVPHGVLTSGNSTLKEYGFVQNILLYLKPCE